MARMEARQEDQDGTPCRDRLCHRYARARPATGGRRGAIQARHPMEEVCIGAILDRSRDYDIPL